VAVVAGGSSAPVESGRSPLLDQVQALTVSFDSATDAGDVQGAVRAVLALENELVAWSRDTAGTDEIDRARAALQGLVVRLGELVPAGAGAADGPAVPDAVVALLVELRAAARAAKDYALGDRIRDTLIEAGIELRDGPDGTTWGSRPAG
jgi:cysteinyl-tRNA synthetase